jgi:peroxiredoxin
MTVLRRASRFVLIVLLSAIAGGAGVYLFQDKLPWRRMPSGPPVPDFALLDHQGRFHQLYRHTQAKAVVLYTHGLGCAAVRDNLPSLRALQKTYAPQGVEFLMLNANPEDDRAALKAEAERLKIAMPILKDESQLVAKTLQVERTGEAILIDTQTWSIRYRGPVDDRVSYGAQRETARQHHLSDAIDAVLDDDPVDAAQVQTVGCIINRDQPQEAPRAVSYAQDVTPILREKCITCHRPGGPGPWSMDDYKTVKNWSPMMREAIMTKRMPPWHADSGAGEFFPDWSLSVAEQKTLVDWIDANAPHDGQEDPLQQHPPEAAPEWALGQPDLILDLPEQKIPAHGVVAYSWVKIPVPVKEDVWVRATQLKPSNNAVMHHGFVLVQYPKDRASEQPAWDQGRNGFFAAHVPGLDPQPLPEGSGQLVPAGSMLMFQLHYVTIGTPEIDRPRLALYFHKTPPAMEYGVASASNRNIRIPAFKSEHQETAEMTFQEPVKLQGFYPHMHYRGRYFTYEAQYPDGRSERLLSVPNYNFGWQAFYHYKQPKDMPAGTKIVIRAGFDNSEQNPVNPDPAKEVRWGLNDTDEMLVGYLMYTRERRQSKAVAAR